MNYLTHIGKDETGRSGCIAGTVKWPPTEISTVCGFAEVDPNGLFATDDEADQLAQYLAGCWNAFSGSGIPTAALTPGLVAEMLEALRSCYDELKKHDLAGPPGVSSILAKLKETQP